jgi:hypothetical protein
VNCVIRLNVVLRKSMLGDLNAWMTWCLRVSAAHLLLNALLTHGVCFDAGGSCGPLWPSMPRRKQTCAKLECHQRYEPTRKGCGGRQYIQAEYIEHCKTLLKTDAKVGDWICTDCRNELRAIAAVKGIDMNADVCECLSLCCAFE